MNAPITGSDALLPPIGLIAGGGRLPVLIAQGARAAGRKVACVGLSDQYDPELRCWCDHFDEAGIVRLGRWIRLLRGWGVQEAVLIGKVEKTRMYDPLRFVRQLPDLRAARVWFFRVRNDRRSQKLLRAVADELSEAGIELIDTTRYIPEHLAHAGMMTSRGFSGAQEKDIEFGWSILTQVASLDIGQAIAVKDRDVIAVEAIEGTDAMIRRAGELCRNGGWVLLKAPMPKHDMRFDVPTIGLQTIQTLKEARGAGIVVQAGKCILADKPDFLAAADKAGIFVYGKA